MLETPNDRVSGINWLMKRCVTGLLYLTYSGRFALLNITFIVIPYTILYFVLWHPHHLSGISASDLLSVSIVYLCELPGDADGPAKAIAANKKGLHTPAPKVAECKNVKVA